MVSKNFCVNYLRDGLSEEVHEGVFQLGFDSLDDKPYHLRSCAKPLQASLLIDNEIDFTPEELAFCSGSHAGEECHIQIARKIMDKIGVKESDLKCGIHPPLSRTMQNKMLLKGEAPSQLHNNCSGKHLGFLALCIKNGWNIKTYDNPEHPLQKAVKNKIYELCEIKKEYPFTTDGCGVPIVSAPLKNLISGFGNLSSNYSSLVKAIINNPYIYGGEDRTDTEIIQNSKNIIAKVGAGGLCIVYKLILNEGFALKMYDASMSARRIAVLEIINNLGWANIFYDNKIKTISGKTVGQIIVTY